MEEAVFFDEFFQSLIFPVRDILYRSKYMRGAAAYLRRALYESAIGMSLLPPPPGFTPEISRHDTLETVAAQFASAAYVELFSTTFGPLVQPPLPALPAADAAKVRVAYNALQGWNHVDVHILRAQVRNLRWMRNANGARIFSSVRSFAGYMSLLVQAPVHERQAELFDNYIRGSLALGGEFHTLQWSNFATVLDPATGSNFVAAADLEPQDNGRTAYWHFVNRYMQESVLPVLTRLNANNPQITHAQAFDELFENLARHLLMGIIVRFQATIQQLIQPPPPVIPAGPAHTHTPPAADKHTA